MDGWIDGWMDGRMDGWMEGWMDGRMDGWMDGRMGGWKDGYGSKVKLFICTLKRHVGLELYTFVTLALYGNG